MILPLAFLSLGAGIFLQQWSYTSLFTFAAVFIGAGAVMTWRWAVNFQDDQHAGISGDRFTAALIGLGAPERGVIQAIKSAGEELGMLDAHTHIEFLPFQHVSTCFPNLARNLFAGGRDRAYYLNK